MFIITVNIRSEPAIFAILEDIFDGFEIYISLTKM